MTARTLKDCRIYMDGQDMSGDLNRVGLDSTADELESTTLDSTGYKEFVAGLITAKLDGEVFSQLGTGLIEEKLMAVLAGGSKVVSIYHPGQAAGGIGEGMDAETMGVSPVMTMGDLARITIKASRSGSALVRITSMEGRVVKTASGTGTVRSIGAASADQSLHSFLQVLAASGASPQLTVTVKSDDAAGFSSPTTQITHSTFSAAGAEHKTKAGAITDTYYRVDWTISGTDPSFTFDVGLGIV